MTPEDELILLRLKEGIQGTLHKHKLLEKIQISNMSLEVSIKFLQLELIKEFN